MATLVSYDLSPTEPVSTATQKIIFRKVVPAPDDNPRYANCSSLYMQKNSFDYSSAENGRIYYLFIRCLDQGTHELFRDILYSYVEEGKMELLPEGCPPPVFTSEPNECTEATIMGERISQIFARLVVSLVLGNTTDSPLFNNAKLTEYLNAVSTLKTTWVNNLAAAQQKQVDDLVALLEPLVKAKFDCAFAIFVPNNEETISSICAKTGALSSLKENIRAIMRELAMCNKIGCLMGTKESEIDENLSAITNPSTPEIVSSPDILLPEDGKNYYIVSYATNKVYSTVNPSFSPASYVYYQDCMSNDGDKQHWVFNKNGDGTWTIKSKATDEFIAYDPISRDMFNLVKSVSSNQRANFGLRSHPSGAIIFTTVEDPYYGLAIYNEYYINNGGLTKVDNPYGWYSAVVLRETCLNSTTYAQPNIPYTTDIQEHTRYFFINVANKMAMYKEQTTGSTINLKFADCKNQNFNTSPYTFTVLKNGPQMFQITDRVMQNNGINFDGQSTFSSLTNPRTNQIFIIVPDSTGKVTLQFYGYDNKYLTAPIDSSNSATAEGKMDSDRQKFYVQNTCP